MRQRIGRGVGLFARLPVAWLSCWAGWVVTPLVFPKWTHAQEFAWLSRSELWAWVTNPHWLWGPLLVASAFYVLNASLLLRLRIAGVAAWGFMTGAYFSSHVMFDAWHVLDTMEVPSQLETAATLGIVVLLVAIPTVCALSVWAAQNLSLRLLHGVAA